MQGSKLTPKSLVCWKSGQNTWKSGKIPWKFGKKWRPTLFDVKKWRATFTEKQTKTFFGEVTLKRGLYDLCGRKFVGKSRTKAFRETLENSGKNPLHLQKICLLLHLCAQAVPSPRGDFGGLSPPNKAPSPPNWNMKRYKSVEFLSIFRVSSPPIENFLATVLAPALSYKNVSALVVSESEKDNQFMLAVFSKWVVLRTKVSFKESGVL